MQLALISDLHLEHDYMPRRSWLATTDFKEADVVVLAGDILPLTNQRRVDDLVRIFAWAKKPAIYVPGNHEYWGTSPKEAHEVLEKAITAHGHGYFTWLKTGETHTIAGRRFIGSTMWFSEPLEPNAVRCKGYMDDFDRIRDLEPWVYEENSRWHEWSLRNIEENDIVVTHYLPSMNCVASQYRSSDLNHFFVYDMEGVINLAKPALWVHGHTHTAHKTMIGGTLTACNPLGYPAEKSLRKYKPLFIPI